MGALSNKGGRGQRNREEIGARTPGSTKPPCYAGYTEDKIVSKYCNKAKTLRVAPSTPPPFPRLYHGGVMNFRVRPRVKLMGVMLDIPCQYKHYCVVLLCEVYYGIV